MAVPLDLNSLRCQSVIRQLFWSRFLLVSVDIKWGVVESRVVSPAIDLHDALICILPARAGRPCTVRWENFSLLSADIHISSQVYRSLQSSLSIFLRSCHPPPQRNQIQPVPGPEITVVLGPPTTTPQTQRLHTPLALWTRSEVHNLEESTSNQPSCGKSTETCP